MKKILITLLSVATLGMPVLAAAADDDAKGKRDSKPSRAERQERSADGEQRERPARGERPDFASMTIEEKLTMLKKRMKANPKMAKMLTKRFDKDGNDALSDTELTAAAEAMGKRGAKGMRGKKEKRGGKKRSGSSEGAES
ncbi:MAG: Ni/Co efflux regulator RcnB [Verrucomicrobiales bacterium]|jgi:Ni/Co efflux regulator RcnB